MSCHTSHLFSCIEQSICQRISFVDLLIDHLALWRELTLDNAPHIEEYDQHGFDSLSWLYSKIHLSSPVVTLHSNSGSVWKCLMMSEGTWVWRFFWSSFSSLGTIFAQTFYIPKSSVIIFQTLSFFLYSADLWSFELSTKDHHILIALPAQHWPQCCMTHRGWYAVKQNSNSLLKASYTWSHLSLSCNLLWTSCIAQKCVRYGVISINLMKHFKFLWQFYPTGLKISSLFIALCSLFVL